MGSSRLYFCCVNRDRDTNEGKPSAAMDSQPVKAIDSHPFKLVMRKYRMFMSEEDIMGEGTSSVCRKGRNIETGELVAIKVYKSKRSSRRSPNEEVSLIKFQRQIAV